jgi:hypothetical protein
LTLNILKDVSVGNRLALDVSEADTEDDHGSDMSYEAGPLELLPLQLDNFSTQLNLQATLFAGADHQVVK